MFQIAIDGPAGSGKSTVAKKLADQLNFTYISTGKYYRAYAYIMQKYHLSIEKFLASFNDYQILINQNKVTVNNEDISNLINNEAIGHLASMIATNKQIRIIAIESQKASAKNQSVIMDGRDIGTVVLPNANLKIFLVANSEIRAKRRAKELNLNTSEIDRMKAEIEQRDAQDISREFDPLIKADDAIEIDTSNLSIEEVVNKIIELYQKRK